MARTEIISLRLKNEELESLMKLPSEYGATTSQKIRHLIKAASQEAPQEKLERSTNSKVDWTEGKKVSDVIAAILELEDLSSTCARSNWEESEEALQEEFFRLCEKILLLDVSTRSKILNKKNFKNGLDSLNKVMKAVEQLHNSKEI